MVAAGRVALLALAMLLGILGYREQFLPEIPWWRWLGELVAGSALLTLALPAPKVEEAHARRLLRWLAGAVAAGAGIVAVQLQPQPGREVATATCYCVALGAFALSRWRPFATEEVEALVGDLSVSAAIAGESVGWRAVRALGAAAAVAVGIAAACVNGAHHLAAFLLWLGSLVLFAAAVWRRAPAPAGAERWRREAGPELSSRAAGFLLLVILVLALALRVTLLKDVPSLLDPDEGRQGRWAERMWQDGFPDAFGLGWNVFPNLAYMTEYVGVQALGTSNAHLRLSAATIGVLSLVPVFFWVRRWWGNVIALMAVFLLAINRDHIAWSRVALNNIQQVLVAGLILAAFARLLRGRRAIDWVWLGYAIGLAFHTYHAAKLFPALLAVAALLFAVGMRGFVRRHAAGALIGALACLLCIGPLLVTMYRGWGMFYGGTSNRVDLAQLSAAYHRGDIPEVRAYIGRHVIGCLMSFTAIPEEGPTFDPFVAVPFLLGVGWMLWRWRDPRHLVVLVWTLGILAIGGMITDSPPWKARLLGYLPTICLIPAVVAGRARQALWRWFPARADVLGMPLLIVWLGAALYTNWHNVFIDIPRLQRGDILTSICRTIDETPLPATFYMAGAGVMAEPKVASHDCMIAASPERFLVDLSDDPAIVPVPPTNRGTAVLLVSWVQQELLPLVRHYYPEAHYEIVHEAHGFPVLHVFTLPPDVIERSRGLRATYRGTSRTWSALAATGTFAPPADAAAGEFPLRAVWRGQLWAEKPGVYAFRSGTGSLRVDKTAVAEATPIGLAAGWHTLELSAEFTSAGSDPIALEWKPPAAGEWAPIPRAFLQTHPDSHGLLGRFFAREISDQSAAPIGQTPDYLRLDAAVSFDFNVHFDEPPPPPFAAPSSTMEWSGTVNLTEGDVQGIRLEATTPTQVFINGRLAIASGGTRDARPVTAELGGLSGRVPIVIRSVRPGNDKSDFWKLRVLWRSPGGGWTAFVDYRPEATPAS